MPLPLRVLLVPILLASLVMSPSSSMAADDVITVVTDKGHRFAGRVDARTNAEQLYLRFGTDSATLIVRRFDWTGVTAALHEGRQLDQQQLLAMAEQAATEIDGEPLPSAVQPRKGDETLKHFPGRSAGCAQRVTSVQFDVTIANWDADVEVDGLLMHIRPLDCRGYTLPVDGHVEVRLIAARHAPFHHVPRGRGQALRVLKRWRVPLRAESVAAAGGALQLPFDRDHPELDSGWDHHGLVHVRLIAPGHGVFHDSLDAVRIRPFAPVRDAYERTSGRRFFPEEMVRRPG